jgi:phosphoribosyl 1,2-cyclic phosphodiesterase
LIRRCADGENCAGIPQNLLSLQGMSMVIASMNSGSNGNCYYAGNDREAVLIDAGISCRETEKRLLQSGLNIRHVKAIFISHEHSDHIRGLAVLARKYQLPVYINQATYRHSGLNLPGELLFDIIAGQDIMVGDLRVKSFSKLHDAADPISFTISTEHTTVGVFTDLGGVCSNLEAHFSQCHAAFLEANYDEQMLEQGRYPWHLKNRIRSGRGHLSNTQALKLFLQHRPHYMSHLILAHLSRDNNDPDLVAGLFAAQGTATNITVASRYGASPVFHINPQPLVRRRQEYAAQLSLF